MKTEACSRERERAVYRPLAYARSYITTITATVALVCTLPAGAAAQKKSVELKADGIAVPFFDANGKLTHRLNAKTGVVTGAAQSLRDVELVYYSTKDPTRIVQTLLAADALWDPKKETLTGRGAIEVITEESKLTGEGFDFTLSTALLHLHHAFTMATTDLRLTSDRATVELMIEQKGDDRKVRDVKRCEAIGNLHVVIAPAARERYNLEELWSPLAIYDGATQIITFPQPTRSLVKGRTVESQTMTINLSAK